MLGATPTSYIAGRVGRGIDLREHGSKNLGATNVYRILGWKYAIPVALIDIAKGAVPVLVFSHPVWLSVAVGAAAVLGHMFSPYVSFKGGKGVATAAGVLLGVAPVAIGICAILWLVIVLASGYVSLGSIVAATAFPVITRLLTPEDTYAFVAGLAMAALIVYTHRVNIRRLLNGTESRFGHRRKEA